MRGRFSLLVAIPLLGFLTGSVALAGDAKIKTGATVYYDYFVDLNDQDDSYTGATSGFMFRRAYFTIKHSWDNVTFRYTTDIDYKRPKFVTDVDVDVDSLGGPAEVSTSTTGGALNVYGRYIYLQWKNLIPNASLYIGQHSPKTHGWVEEYWHYRSVEMTMSDIWKWTNSAEVGIGLQGTLADKRLEYYLDLNNGTGYKKSLSRNALGFAARLAFKPASGFVVSGVATASNPGGQGKQSDTYFEGTAGYENDRFGLFGVYGHFTSEPSEVVSTGISVFGRLFLREGLHALGRYDLVDPNDDADDDRHGYLILGFSCDAHEVLSIQPTYRLRTDEAPGTDDDSEVRLTFYTKF